MWTSDHVILSLQGSDFAAFPRLRMLRIHEGFGSLRVAEDFAVHCPHVTVQRIPITFFSLGV
jgi:hypothetical protein